MNSHPHNLTASETVSPALTGEETLRLLAGLPAPAGLEDRLRQALSTAPRQASQPGRLLAWPAALRCTAGNNWLRSAAAAAIVFVVIGGGWGVYSRVQPGPAPKTAVLPVRGGFSSAGAVRTPVTLPGPAAVQPAPVSTAPAKTKKKAGAKTTPTVKTSKSAGDR
jgi:hypothetical protein